MKRKVLNTGGYSIVLPSAAPTEDSYLIVGADLQARWEPVTPTYEQETLDYETAVVTEGGSLSTAAKDAIDAFYKAAATNAYKTKLDWLWVPYGGGLNASKCCLFHPSGAGTKMVYNNYVAADFSNSSGMNPGAGNTNKYADSGISASAQFTEDNTHLMFWSNSNITDSGGDIGSRGASSTNWAIICRNTGGSTYMPVYSTPGDAPNFSTADSLGCFLMSRTANNSVKGYKNGSLQTTNTNARSSTLATQNILVHWVNGFGDYSDRICWAAGAGQALTDSEVTDYYTDLNTLLNALRV